MNICFFNEYFCMHAYVFVWEVHECDYVNLCVYVSECSTNVEESVVSVSLLLVPQIPHVENLKH